MINALMPGKYYQRKEDYRLQMIEWNRKIIKEFKNSQTKKRMKTIYRKWLE